MAHPDEQQVTNAIGLGSGYRFWNGSGSCGGARRRWIRDYPEVMERFGLQVDPRWVAKMKEADEADQFDGEDYTLTNVWVAISYAVQSAIYVAAGSEPLDPSEMRFRFLKPEKEVQWRQRRGRVKVNANGWEDGPYGVER